MRLPDRPVSGAGDTVIIFLSLLLPLLSNPIPIPFDFISTSNDSPLVAGATSAMADCNRLRELEGRAGEDAAAAAFCDRNGDAGIIFIFCIVCSSSSSSSSSASFLSSVATEDTEILRRRGGRIEEAGEEEEEEDADAAAAPVPASLFPFIFVCPLVVVVC